MQLRAHITNFLLPAALVFSLGTARLVTVWKSCWRVITILKSGKLSTGRSITNSSTIQPLTAIAVPYQFSARGFIGASEWSPSPFCRTKEIAAADSGAAHAGAASLGLAALALLE